MKFHTYGEPDIRLGGLRIWVHRRCHPEARDYWDANWVQATATCADENASVTVDGPILHLSEIEAWAGQLESLYRTIKGEANLECIEPNLAVAIRCDHLGHLEVKVAITPDHLSQSHSFSMQFDQTHLRYLIGNCRKILEEYPIRERLAAEGA